MNDQVVVAVVALALMAVTLAGVGRSLRGSSEGVSSGSQGRTAKALYVAAALSAGAAAVMLALGVFGA
jgi:hypothetical protein